LPLGRVSEAAAALFAQKPHAGDSLIAEMNARNGVQRDTAMPRLCEGRPTHGEIGPPATVFAPVQSLHQRRSMAGVGSFVALVSPAIVFLLVVKLPVATFWEWPGDDRTFELASSSSYAVKSLAVLSEQQPRLLAHGSRATRGEPALLGLMLQGRAERAVVTIAGLVPGMTLSSGRAVGADVWEVPASDLADTWVGPPPSFVGAVNLVAELRLADATIAHRQPVHIEWTAATAASPERVTTAASPTSAEQVPTAMGPAAPDEVSATAAVPALPLLERSEIAPKDSQHPSTGDPHAASSHAKRGARNLGAAPAHSKEGAKAFARHRAEDGLRPLVQRPRALEGRATASDFVDAIILPRRRSDPVEIAPALPHEFQFIRRR
jgi:hypothetical protein